MGDIEDRGYRRYRGHGLQDIHTKYVTGYNVQRLQEI